MSGLQAQEIKCFYGVGVADIFGVPVGTRVSVGRGVVVGRVPPDFNVAVGVGDCAVVILWLAIARISAGLASWGSARSSFQSRRAAPGWSNFSNDNARMYKKRARSCGV